ACLLIFFFSIRRRHTRFSRDWSSDVCSSDLVVGGQALDTRILYDALEAPADTPISEIPSPADDPEGHELGIRRLKEGLEVAKGRSEERRVGKECRGRCIAYASTRRTHTGGGA